MPSLAKFICSAIVAVSLGLPLVTPASAQRAADLFARDLSGASDHPLVGRYQGSALLAQSVKAFDELTLPAGPAEGRSANKFAAIVSGQGKVTRSIYIAPPGRSSLEVTTNFVDALVGKGFETVYSCAGAACGEGFARLKYRWNKPETKVLGENYEHQRKLMVDAVFDQLIELRYSLFRKAAAEGDTYVAVYGGLHRGGGFGNSSTALQDRVGVLVEVVEPRAMDRAMVVVNATEIGNKVATEGRAVFYGIQCDFDKADVKPDSEKQLAEMARYLQGNPRTRVYIIGHTDNKGGLDYNVGLSNRRAEAVVRALAGKYRIDAKRLTPRGLGPLAPIASNRSEDGQAKNRRVEMVEQ
jgi:outer membrane protein OmpA-like peptidoglycan-associated protein